MTPLTLKIDRLGDLLAKMAAAGFRIVAPVASAESDTSATAPRPRQAVRFAVVGPQDYARVDLTATPAAEGIKRFFLPQSEAVVRMRQNEGQSAQVSDISPDAPPTIIFGARPCDAAALPVLDRVFSWDSDDRSWSHRRQQTLVITIACQSSDAACFCTSIGGAPDSTAGSDALLVPQDDGTMQVRLVGERGEKLRQFFDADDAGSAAPREDATTGDSGKAGQVTVVPPRFDISGVRSWIENNFDDKLWDQAALACLGCGACTYGCPTCHCFDLVDEGTEQSSLRRRNWDSCQFRNFTEHASGHNPRPWQTQRYRQRIAHKFAYFPERFGTTLCTGCGRCVRVCPAGVSLLEIVGRIAAKGKIEEGRADG